MPRTRYTTRDREAAEYTSFCIRVSRFCKFAWPQMRPVEFFLGFSGPKEAFPEKTRGFVLWRPIFSKGAWCHYPSIPKFKGSHWRA